MIKIIFFATPDIALNSLDYLNNSEKIEVLAVVTQPDKPSGRGNKIVPCPIKRYAIEHNIKVFQPKSIRKEYDIQAELKKLEPDYFVTFAFGQILSKEVLAIPKYETINLHASLLPKYRGANPIQRALINGETKTGICTMITEEGLDCGDVCLRQEIDIPLEMNFEDLFNIISTSSPQLIEKTLLGLQDKSIIPEKQDDTKATTAPKFLKEEAKINWNKPAAEIHNLVRGIYKAPSAYTLYNGKILKIMETMPLDNNCPLMAGEVVNITKDGLEISTSKGTLLIKKVKPEGKGEMSARDWANGSKIKIGDRYDN